MKSARYLLIVLLVGIFATVTNGQKKFKKYAHKSGMIEYQMEGSASGTQVMYWDDYGYKEAHYEESVTKMFGQKTEKKEVIYHIGSQLYTWDQLTDQVMKMDNPVVAQWEEDGVDDQDVEAFGKAMLENMGYEKTENEEVLGKNCEVWEGMGKLWIWKGLTVKSEVKMMGVKVNMTATKIETDIAIPADKFKVPEGKKVVSPGGDTPDDGSEKSKKVKGMLKNLFGGDDK